MVFLDLVVFSDFRENISLCLRKRFGSKIDRSFIRVFLYLKSFKNSEDYQGQKKKKIR
jgi:hypothetical protein